MLSQILSKERKGFNINEMKQPMVIMVNIKVKTAEKYFYSLKSTKRLLI